MQRATSKFKLINLLSPKQGKMANKESKKQPVLRGKHRRSKIQRAKCLSSPTENQNQGQTLEEAN